MDAKKITRWIAVAVIITQILILLPVIEIHSAAETTTDLPALNEMIVGTVDFQSFNFLGDNAPGSDGVDYSSTFYYTDDFFSPSALNPTADSKSEQWTELTENELALASVSFDLTVAAYASNENNVLTATTRSWDNTYYPGKDKNAKTMLESCGFEHFESYETYNQAPTNDSIGYVIASKKIRVWDSESEENKDYTLVAVAVRGAGYGAEWASNITIGDPSTNSLPSNGRHYGFDDVANKVCSGIRDYLSAHQISSDVKYWISGYSRAGATANLVAGTVTDQAENVYHTRKKDVYGYTWECPQGASNSENPLNYKNIHNIINAMDAVPKVSPDEFQHQRLGVDYVMPYYGNTTSSENTQYYTNMRDVLKTIAVGAYDYAGASYTEDPLIGITDPANYPYNRAMTIYTITATKLISDAVNGELMDNFGTVVASGDKNKLGTNLYLDQFVDNLIDVFLTSKAWVGDIGGGRTAIQNRKTFIEQYQGDFRNVLGYLLDFSGPAFLGMVDAIVDAIGDQLRLSNALDNGGLALAFTNFYNYPTSTYKWGIPPFIDPWIGSPSWANKTRRAVLIEEAQPVVRNVLRTMTNGFTDPQGITRTQFENSMDKLVALVVNLYADELSRYNSNYFGTSLHYMWQILCTHEQEVVMSWIKSLDPNHMNRGYRTLTVPKNTDVKLYEFRKAYAEYEGTLSADSKGVLVAEVRDGSFVSLSDPTGKTVETLDQRISVTSDGDNMILRYPSMLDIRMDIAAMDEDTFFEDVPFRVSDYRTNDQVTALSDGKDQYDPALSKPENYTEITTQQNRTNAAVINGYNTDYSVPLSHHDVLQIMAKGSTSYDNSASGDRDVYSVNKMVYVNTVVEGQFRRENGGTETYLPYVMDRSGSVTQPEEMESEISYASVRGTGSDAATETGSGNSNSYAHVGNRFEIELPVVAEGNKISKYFVTDAGQAHNRRLSSDETAYLPEDLVDESTNRFDYDPGTSLQEILEARDRVYHVFYDGDFTYTVIWKNWDGSLLERDENVRYNTVPSYDGEEPVKPSSGEDQVYVFTGWSPDVSPVTGDREYTAQFELRDTDPATFTLVHQDGTEEPITVKNAAKGIDVTERRKEGTLYGGLFQDPSYKTASETPGTGLIPENGMTYYMREVPDTYLNLRTIYIRSSGQIKGSYSVANIDSDLYDKVGFLYSNETPSESKDIYKSVTVVTYPNGQRKESSATASMLFHGEERDHLAVDSINRKDYSGKVQAYWITMDGVRVTGAVQRSMESGAFSEEESVKSENTAVKDIDSGTTSPLHSQTAFIAEEQEETQPEDRTVRLLGYTLSLNGTISMNFYMELGEEVLQDHDGAYMQFALPGANHTSETVKLSEVMDHPRSINGKTYYVFSAGVAAKDMTGEIQAQFILPDGTKTETYRTSIKAYCDYIRAHPGTNAGQYDEKAVALAETMLNYGGYTQSYFGHHTDALANADLNLALPEVKLGEEYKAVISGNCTGFNYLGSALMLTSSTGIRHYFSGAPEDYVFLAGEEELTPKTSDGRNYVEITGIKALKLDEPVTLTVINRQDGSQYSLQYSAFTYIRQILGKSSTSEKAINMLKALYGYWSAAEQYFSTDH